MDSAKQDAPCRLVEVPQYSCVLKKNSKGMAEVKCLPLPRVFWSSVEYFPSINPLTFDSCKNRPMIEVTTLLEYDGSGKVIPPNTAELEARFVGIISARIHFDIAC
jgi:hypothetical protein